MNLDSEGAVAPLASPLTPSLQRHCPDWDSNRKAMATFYFGRNDRCMRMGSGYSDIVARNRSDENGVHQG